jgi:hypothetical protein
MILYLADDISGAREIATAVGACLRGEGFVGAQLIDALNPFPRPRDSHPEQLFTQARSVHARREGLAGGH